MPVKFPAEYHRQWRKKSYESANVSRIKYQYKVTEEEARTLLKLIEGGCSICGRTWKKRLCIDHDHVTGRIRGVLCHNCNVVLGLIKESREILARMQEYLDAGSKSEATEIYGSGIGPQESGTGDSNGNVGIAVGGVLGDTPQGTAGTQVAEAAHDKPKLRYRFKRRGD